MWIMKILWIHTVASIQYSTSFAIQTSFCMFYPSIFMEVLPPSYSCLASSFGAHNCENQNSPSTGCREWAQWRIERPTQPSEAFQLLSNVCLPTLQPIFIIDTDCALLRIRRSVAKQSSYYSKHFLLHQNGEWDIWMVECSCGFRSEKTPFMDLSEWVLQTRREWKAAISHMETFGQKRSDHIFGIFTVQMMGT